MHKYKIFIGGVPPPQKGGLPPPQKGGAGDKTWEWALRAPSLDAGVLQRSSKTYKFRIYSAPRGHFTQGAGGAPAFIFEMKIFSPGGARGNKYLFPRRGRQSRPPKKNYSPSPIEGES
jgi:hypothetical protein